MVYFSRTQCICGHMLRSEQKWRFATLQPTVSCIVRLVTSSVAHKQLKSGRRCKASYCSDTAERKKADSDRSLLAEQPTGCLRAFDVCVLAQVYQATVIRSSYVTGTLYPNQKYISTDNDSDRTKGLTANANMSCTRPHRMREIFYTLHWTKFFFITPPPRWDQDSHLI